jgi:plasmid stabilization system protein ParE
VINSVYWSPIAEKDFEQIVDYLQVNWSDSIALNFIDDVEKSIFL